MTQQDNFQRKLSYFPENKALKPYYFTDYNKFWTLYYATDKQEERQVLLRDMFRRDLFFLIFYGLNRRDVNHYNKPFIVQACKEVQSSPDTDTLDLWSRGHYKSTIITQGRSLQDVLRNFEASIGIFSHTRPAAKDFLLPIKAALEGNPFLRFAFPDLIWQNPQRDAPVWSMDSGIELNRSTTSNTHSFEAWGLVDGMPTGKHYDIRVYDDVITDKVVSVDMMHKASDQFRLSDNLAADGGWERVIGTNYSHGDFYQQRTEEAEKGVYPWIVRRKPWYDDKALSETEKADLSLEYLTVFGARNPVLLAPQQILDKWRKQSEYIFACQMALDPANEATAEFKASWIKRYRKLPANRTKYILVDPANEKKKGSDYTAIACVSVDDSGIKYLEDLVRDKLDLGQRWDAIKGMYRKNKPISGGVWYEKYGKDSDIWYFEQRQLQDGVYFGIEPFGGSTGKRDRIRRLIPVFRNGQFLLPENGIWYLGQDLVQYFINDEYIPFPYCTKFDVIDVISRIEDPQIEAVGPIVDTGHGSITALNEMVIEQRAVDGL